MDTLRLLFVLQTDPVEYEDDFDLPDTPAGDRTMAIARETKRLHATIAEEVIRGTRNSR